MVSVFSSNSLLEYYLEYFPKYWTIPLNLLIIVPAYFIYILSTSILFSVPGKPTMMISTTMGNTALIQWQPPKDMVGELMGYQLQYKRTDEETLTSRELRKTDDHYTVTGLHKGATYVFRLSARNRAGIGEAYVKEISTPEDVPSGFPLNLQVTGLTQSSTQLTWEPPLLAERNGKITYYTVVYRDINSQQNSTNRTTDTYLTIQGLNPDTTYDIRVQAFTSKGGGPLSPSIQSRTMSNGRITGRTHCWHLYINIPEEFDLKI